MLGVDLNWTVFIYEGMTDSEVIRLEMLTLLCMADRTHSNLMDSVPDRCAPIGHSLSKDIEPTLKQVSLVMLYFLLE